MLKSFFVFGTVINIWFEQNEAAMNEIVDLVYKMDNLWSIFKVDSDISNINRFGHNTFVQVNKLTIDIIKKSIHYYKITDGYMDITCKPLLDFEDNVSDNIKDVIKLSDSRNIVIKDDKIRLKKRGMQLDLGSIAKGYASDMIVNILDKYNIDNALIDLGGNIYVKGYNNKGSLWRVGIQDPFNKAASPIGYVEISNKSVVTSGLYERGNHIINTHTGKRVSNNIKSVSVISNRSLDGDGLSTALFVMGLEGIKKINKIRNVDCIYIDDNKNIHMTKQVKKIFVLLNSSYNVV